MLYAVITTSVALPERIAVRSVWGVGFAEPAELRERGETERASSTSTGKGSEREEGVGEEGEGGGGRWWCGEVCGKKLCRSACKSNAEERQGREEAWQKKAAASSKRTRGMFCNVTSAGVGVGKVKVKMITTPPPLATGKADPVPFKNAVG